MAGLGATVQKNDLLGVISDPFGIKDEEVLATANGIIIGRTTIPLVNEGEALFHIARFKSPDDVADQAEELQNLLDPDNYRPGKEEPPIV